MASNKTGADRVTKEEYLSFLLRDSEAAVCPDRTLREQAAKPVDRIFAIADADGDGALDVSELAAWRLADPASIWILAGDVDGDGMIDARELADGLPQFNDLLPRSGKQLLPLAEQARIRELRALAVVEAYDTLAVNGSGGGVGKRSGDGKLDLAEMRLYSEDHTRRSMGQTLVPLWALMWRYSKLAVRQSLDGGSGGGGSSSASPSSSSSSPLSSYLSSSPSPTFSKLSPWNGPAALAATTDRKSVV